MYSHVVDTDRGDQERPPDLRTFKTLLSLVERKIITWKRRREKERVWDWVRNERVEVPVLRVLRMGSRRDHTRVHVKYLRRVGILTVQSPSHRVTTIGYRHPSKETRERGHPTCLT